MPQFSPEWQPHPQEHSSCRCLGVTVSAGARPFVIWLLQNVPVLFISPPALLWFGFRVAQQGKGIRNEIIFVTQCIIAASSFPLPQAATSQAIPRNFGSGKAAHSPASLERAAYTNGPAHQCLCHLLCACCLQDTAASTLHVLFTSTSHPPTTL